MSDLAYKVGRCLLRQLLKDANMTQVELATRLDVTKQQVNKYVLNHRVMSLEVAVNVAEILNCDVRDLYEWVEVGRKE